MSDGPRPRSPAGLTLSLMRGRLGRLIATFVAIFAGVAFAAASVVVTESLRASAEDAVAAQARAADVVVTPDPGRPSSDLVQRIARVDGATAVDPVREDYADVELGGRPSLSRVGSLPAAPSLRTGNLTAGRWPGGPGEVVVDAVTAGENDLTPGARLVMQPSGRPMVTVTVAGVVRVPDKVGGDVAAFFAADRDVMAWTGAPVDVVYVLGGADVDRAELRDRVAAAADGVTTRTGEQQASRELAEFAGGEDVLTVGLQLAAGIGFLVAALVIANTFQVVVAQRSREYALLRCVGARRGQVVGIVLREAALLGSAGSALGLVAGGACGSVVVAVLSRSGTALPLTCTEVPMGAMLAAGLVGVTTTVLAVLAAAGAAARRRPLEALREVAVTGTDLRASTFRVVAGLTLTVAGGAGLAFGAGAGSMAVTAFAGTVAFAGVLVSVQPLVVALLYFLRGPLEACGTPARLAWANLARNPRRAAAAVTALLVGITLVSTVLVGVATSRATLTSEVNARYPVDAEVLAGRNSDLPPGLPDSLADIPGVADVVTVAGTTVRLGDMSRPVLAVGADARRIGRDGLVTPTPGEIVVPAAVARNSRIAEGSLVPLSAGSSTVVLRATVSPADLGAPLVAPADLRLLDAAAGPRAIWLRTVPSPDPAAVTEAVRSATSASGAGAILNGAVRLRATYQGALDTATLVALGLLAISVAIAVVGVGNTLTLSVLERRRESALVRALGLTRAKLRGSLACEAVVIGFVAALGGIALGAALGVAGSYALLEFGPRTVPDLPVVQLAGVAVAATVLAALASTLPARIALRAAPAQGLGAD